MYSGSRRIGISLCTRSEIIVSRPIVTLIPKAQCRVRKPRGSWVHRRRGFSHPVFANRESLLEPELMPRRSAFQVPAGGVSNTPARPVRCEQRVPKTKENYKDTRDNSFLCFSWVMHLGSLFNQTLIRRVLVRVQEGELEKMS